MMGILMSVITSSGEYYRINSRADWPFMAVPHISMPKASHLIMDLMPISTKGSSSAINSFIMISSNLFICTLGSFLHMALGLMLCRMQAGPYDF